MGGAYALPLIYKRESEGVIGVFFGEVQALLAD